MHFEELDRGELIAVIGGILLGISLFLYWFQLGNAHATLSSCKGPHTGCTAWNALPVVRFPLLWRPLAWWGAVTRRAPTRPPPTRCATSWTRSRWTAWW